MCARVLPWSTPSSNNSNSNNSAISFSLSAASTSSSTASAAVAAAAASVPPLPSSPGSPSSPPFAFPAPHDSQAALSWAPAAPLSPSPASGTSASAVGPSLLSSPSGGQPSTSTPVSTNSQNGAGGAGSTGTASASLPLPGANGVVVVGIIGRVEHELSQLLDRLLDAHVFGVKNRAADQWQESGEQFLSAFDLTGGTTRERKQRKDAHRRSQSNDASEDGVLQGGEGWFVNSACSETDDLGQKPGSRSGGKVHVKNGLYGKRKEEAEPGTGEKKHVESAEDSNPKKDVQFEVRSGKGGNDDSGKARADGWREGQWSVPWLLSNFKYHHDVEKGTVYVQFTWGVLPLDFLKEDSLKASVARDGLFATLENHDADGMRGLLFMFSVCHVILMVQEGASFDPHLLRIFRLLQTAKHSLAPFVKTQILPGLLPPPSSAARASPLKPTSLGTRQAYSRSGVVGPNSSTVALMSGSTPVLIPGQCTPVVLFVYLEDMPEAAGGLSPHAMTRGEEISELSPPAVYQPGSTLPLSNNSYFHRQNLLGKPAGTGLALLRTNKKPELGLRKKLQVALEAQIRFLLKKCRTVAGFGDTTSVGSGVSPGMGPRGPGGNANSFQGVGSGGALFVLDPSRAVILLDRMANSQTDALDAATDAIEAMFSGRDNLEDMLWDLGSSAVTSGDDLQAVKDFLWRQAEILRGKGGISGNSGGGTGGVGMVAAAAAAAAASAASGLAGGSNKPICNPPELPTFSSWLSACRILAEALSARPAEDSERDAALQKMQDVTHCGMKKGAVSPTTTSGSIAKVVKTKPTMESSLVCLDSGSHLELRFSAAWCERVLPSALDIYLKGLPPSYPTGLHKSQLEKALRVFHSMVRGHAVPLYSEKLKQHCEAVWHSGRQLCDAQSLTGKPCIHQVHDVEGTVSTHSSSDTVKYNSTSSKGMSDKVISKPHSSGVVFLHACACGRSRKLRKDPFDFESANVTFFKFPNCEELLSSLAIPDSSESRSSGGSPWSLVRLGMSRYYQPKVGLVQSGFLPKQNFLSFWDIPLVYSTSEGQIDPVVVSPSKEEVAEVVSFKPHLDSKGTNTSLLRGTKLGSQTKPAGGYLHGKGPEKGYVDLNARATSGNLGTRRGFADSTPEVNYGGESAFPPLPEKQDKLSVATSKPVRQQVGGKEKKNRPLVVQDDENAVLYSGSVNGEVKESKAGASLDAEDGNVPDVRESFKRCSELSVNSVTQHVRVYIGFEHECPHGHRFLLSNSQPDKLTSSNSSLKPGTGPSSKLKKHDRTESRMKNSSSSTGSHYADATTQETSGSAAGPQVFPPKWTQKGPKIPDKMRYWSVQDGDGRSLLDSDLPIYMHCPYCKTSGEDSNSNKKVTFGGTISQLQRVFLVTPSLPLQLASCPVVEFEDISKPAKTVLKFNPGSEIVLPPDSFLSLRLPFVYYSQLGGDPRTSLLVNQNQPERCAWLVKNTALYLLSKGGTVEPTLSESSG